MGLLRAPPSPGVRRGCRQAHGTVSVLWCPTNRENDVILQAGALKVRNSQAQGLGWHGASKLFPLCKFAVFNPNERGWAPAAGEDGS